MALLLSGHNEVKRTRSFMELKSQGHDKELGHLDAKPVWNKSHATSCIV